MPSIWMAPEMSKWRPSSTRGRDVLVQAKKILRVVACLDLGETLKRRTGVRLTHSGFSFVAQEIDIRRVEALLELGRQIVRPLDTAGGGGWGFEEDYNHRPAVRAPG